MCQALPAIAVIMWFIGMSMLVTAVFKLWRLHKAIDKRMKELDQ